MKILIFGSQGNIGKDITKNLKKKFDVYEVDKFKQGKLSKNKLSIDLSKKKIKNEKITSDINSAILLSFYKSQPPQFNTEKPEKFIHKNKNILKNCLEICKINNCKTIIYFSSAAVYSQNNTKKKITEKFTISESNIYSKFKIYAESRIHSYAKENKKKAIVLRLFNIFNNSGNSLTEQLKKSYELNKKIKIIGNGKQKRDFLHTSDISDLLTKIVKKKEKKSLTLNLCSGHKIEINQILTKLKIPKSKIDYDNKNNTNFFLVGNRKKISQLFNWKPKYHFIKTIFN